MSLSKIFSTSKIKNQLQQTSAKISLGLSQIFTHKKLDGEMLEKLEDLLIESDLGMDITNEIIKKLKEQKFNKEIGEKEVKKFLSLELLKVLLPCQQFLQFDDSLKPQVVVMNGVNGVGKTTSIGKIAYLLSLKNKKVMIGACDTFRAGAGEQLAVWANRANCHIVMANKIGEDPASVAHRSFIEAKRQQADVLLIDTAGRLQNKQNLMDELRKINQVIKKIDPKAPHQNILVLDSTTGQNSKNQLEVFDKIVHIDGVIMTKLDGSAKGGILIALCKNFQKPIYAIGIGEAIEDLQEFNAEQFVNNLLEIK